MTPQIHRDGDEIVWSDARDYTGVFVGPRALGEVPPGRTRLAMPVLRFDADQYEAEVRRATNDRSWETDQRVTARLLQSALVGADALRTAGCTVQLVSPIREQAESFSVSFLDPARVQKVVELSAPARRPREWAAELAAQLLADEPDS